MPEHNYVPADFDPASYDQIKHLMDGLLARDLSAASADDLRQWLTDLSDLQKHVDEHATTLYNAHTCDTESDDKEKAYLGFVEHVLARLEPLDFELKKKFLAAPAIGELTEPALRMISRNWQAEVDLFREENVPLATEVTKLTSQYSKLAGAMSIEHDGKDLTLQQAAKFLEEPERSVRQSIWEKVTTRRLQDRDAIDEIYDKQLELRAKIASNADLPSYREYAWKSFRRFDYTPEDALKFGDVMEQVCLPRIEKLHEERQQVMGVDKLRPWDLSVDPKSRPPLKPFDPSDIPGFLATTRKVFDELSPQLGEQFATMKQGRNLDLESRKGKRAGGYQASLELSGEPFIFMNAAGLQRDVETLLHEAGHAFHFIEASAMDLVFVRHSPLEFAEVASMSMEAIAAHKLDMYYDDPEAAARAKRSFWEGTIEKLPWIAVIDGFQHWIYTHPGHSHEERTQAWHDIYGRFRSSRIDYTGYENVLDAFWQKQLHLFGYPFYYIDYGLAQIGALQVWQNYRQDPEAALTKLRNAFKLGGTRPLPELFEAAGIRFDFSVETVEPLMKAIEEELAELPA